MGLFDVHMPLLYGEGTKSFERLQEEILKRSSDHTLFAWTAPRPANIDKEKLMGGFLARSPLDFENSNHYVPCISPYRYWLERPYSMTNLGLCIELPVFEVPNDNTSFIAVLSCTSTDSISKDTRVGFYLVLKNPGPFRNKARSSTEDYRASSSLAVRGIYQSTISLKATSFGAWGLQAQFLTVDWEGQNQGIEVCVLQRIPLFVL
jgi:hypothetical protein